MEEIPRRASLRKTAPRRNLPESPRRKSRARHPPKGSNSMNEHYPRIRIRAENGSILVREGLSFNFYMRRFHPELLPGILRSLETYRSVVGEGLGIYWDREAEYPHYLDAA